MLRVVSVRVRGCGEKPDKELFATQLNGDVNRISLNFTPQQLTDFSYLVFLAASCSDTLDIDS